MSRATRRLIAVDCETDMAVHGRVPKPFIWGAYDGKIFRIFTGDGKGACAAGIGHNGGPSYFRDATEEFLAWASAQNAYLYAHNGGKFDFMFLLPYVTRINGTTKAQIINGRFVKMALGKAELRDSISIIPEALKKFGKTEIDYRKMEANVRDEHMPEIVTYLEQDCRVLHDLVSEYRNVAGKQVTIAGNALKFSRKLGIDPGKTNHTFDKNIRPFFFGGRCQVFQDGSHKNLRVIDIHSAYPFAMTHNHPSGNEREHITYADFKRLSVPEQQRCFIHLQCNSDGAFPTRGKTELSFPVGYGEYRVTGWEYVSAKELGLVSDIRYLNIIRFRDKINFTPYVKHWYEYKARHNKKTNPIQYTIGKIMMNSLYGKLAQNPSRYYDYKLVDPASSICDDPDCDPITNVCTYCGEKDSEHGWQAAVDFEGVKVIRREALWKYRHRHGKAWEGQPLYNNVATGASITGFTRAHLLRAIHAVGIEHVAYCDTDSIICNASASLDKLSLSSNLGDWADEGTASLGHFAGKKQYGLRMHEICTGYEQTQDRICAKCNATENKHGNSPVLKIASKGSKLRFDQIEQLMRGEIVRWEALFPSFSIAGEPSFVVRNIRQTASKSLMSPTPQLEL